MVSLIIGVLNLDCGSEEGFVCVVVLKVLMIESVCVDSVCVCCGDNLPLVFKKLKEIGGEIGAGKSSNKSSNWEILCINFWSWRRSFA